MVMRAGRLRHRITIQQPGTTQDSYGEENAAGTWTTFATRWAAVEPLQGREYFAAQQHLARVTTRFILRKINGVTPKMRILFDGRIYDIDAVMDFDERGIEVQLMAVERVSESP